MTKVRLKVPTPSARSQTKNLKPSNKILEQYFASYGRESAFVNRTHLNGHSFKEAQRIAAYTFLEQ